MPTYARNLTVLNRYGMNLRRTSMLVKCASKYSPDTSITATVGGVTVNGCSVMGLLSLAAGRGTVMTVKAVGPEAEKAIEALTDLVSRRFDADGGDECGSETIPAAHSEWLIEDDGSSREFEKTIPRNTLIYGRAEPPPPRTPLRAGPFSMILESGYIRHVKFGGVEVLRRIYVGIRMHNWMTVLPEIENLRVDSMESSFDVSFTATHKFADVHFVWKGRVTGSEDGTIVFSMDGEALSTFRSNRIGVCVLLPLIETVGRPYEALRMNGTRESGVFPTAISPNHILRDLRAVFYKPDPGLPVEIHCDGDIFDMEDQRNWSDGSFKIYSTMQGMKIPLEVKNGAKFSQTATFRLSECVTPPPVPSVQPREMLRTKISITKKDTYLPWLGLMMRRDSGALSGKELARLRMLSPAFLRFDCVFSEPGWKDGLRQAGLAARALDCQLQIALHLTGAAATELSEAREVLAELNMGRIFTLVFQASGGITPVDLLQLVRRQLAPPGLLLLNGAGTDDYFVTLNRNRGFTDRLGMAAYSLNPQVHTFDNAALVDNLQGQPWTLSTFREIAGHLIPYVRVTMRPVYAIVRDPVAENNWQDGLPRGVDARQISLFCASWTAASISNLAETGDVMIACHEAVGWRGVMESEAGSANPIRFHSVAGTVYPVYHVLADINEFRGGRAIATESSDELAVQALLFKHGDRTRMLVMNLTDEEKDAEVEFPEENVHVRHLDESNAEEAMRFPEEWRNRDCHTHIEQCDGVMRLHLKPYAVVRIDAVAR